VIPIRVGSDKNYKIFGKWTDGIYALNEENN
jgi:hypothetical protein